MRTIDRTGTTAAVRCRGKHPEQPATAMNLFFCHARLPVEPGTNLTPDPEGDVECSRCGSKYRRGKP